MRCFASVLVLLTLHFRFRWLLVGYETLEGLHWHNDGLYVFDRHRFNTTKELPNNKYTNWGDFAWGVKAGGRSGPSVPLLSIS